MHEKISGSGFLSWLELATISVSPVRYCLVVGELSRASWSQCMLGERSKFTCRKAALLQKEGLLTRIDLICPGLHPNASLVIVVLFLLVPVDFSRPFIIGRANSAMLSPTWMSESFSFGSTFDVWLGVIYSNIVLGAFTALPRPDTDFFTA